MLTSDSKNVIIACFTVYELMIREKYEILKEHFHIDSINVTHNEAEDFRQLFSRIADDYDIDRGILQKRISHHDKTPSRNLYISDLHFFHDSLNGFLDHRGFSGFEEMNAYMVKQWNNNVTRKDQVYILGDFSISRGRATNKILDKLNGKKYLIKGNHDRFLEDKEFDRTLFGWVKPYAEVQDEGRKVILSHYPVFCYNGQYRTTKEGKPRSYMLYGHVHDTPDEQLVNSFIKITKEARIKSAYNSEERNIPCNMINCFCMFSDYVPLTLDDWIELDNKRRERLK